MEDYEYETLHRFEQNYWWFRALRATIETVLRRHGVGPGARVLDAGCGTGATAAFLSQKLGLKTYGVDISPSASKYWKGNGLHRACIGTVNSIPFRDGSFDAVIAVDVLECDGVDEQGTYAEMRRVLRRGGLLLLIVPAYKWLMSPEHHKAVHASRRYTRPGLSNLLKTNSMETILMSHLFMSVFPAIAAYRLMRKTRGMRGNGHPHSELKPLPGIINRLLFKSIHWERHLLGAMNLPVGSSILAIARKKER